MWCLLKYDHSTKAGEQYFPVVLPEVLFIMLYKVAAGGGGGAGRGENPETSPNSFLPASSPGAGPTRESRVRGVSWEGSTTLRAPCLVTRNAWDEAGSLPQLTLGEPNSLIDDTGQ